MQNICMMYESSRKQMFFNAGNDRGIKHNYRVMIWLRCKTNLKYELYISCRRMKKHEQTILFSRTSAELKQNLRMD